MLSKCFTFVIRYALQMYSIYNCKSKCKVINLGSIKVIIKVLRFNYLIT